jgi:hypothetical protein
LDLARICEELGLALGGWPPPERRTNGTARPLD